jgi:hypothetical protein
MFKKGLLLVAVLLAISGMVLVPSQGAFAGF